MNRERIRRWLAPAALGALALWAEAPAARADLFATAVVSYTAGTNAAAGYTDPAAALGSPTRIAGLDTTKPGDVTPFNAAYRPAEVVSIGAGGSLVVAFAQAVWDRPQNPFGLDLIVFGNAFFTAGPTGQAASLWAEPAKVAVSQDAVTWYPIPGVAVDGLFPTLGFTDSSGAYARDGTTPTDFSKPADPSIAWQGKTFGELVALYDGSGGGTGIDLAPTGLPWIQYVKVYQDADDLWSAEIDGFAAVSPEPNSAVLLLTGLAAVAARRVRNNRRKGLTS